MAEEILTHSHPVTDTDPHFTIDPQTMVITEGSDNLTIPQRAKNSERLTFYIPASVIEGHDMSTCNKTVIHFQNIDQNTQKKSIGEYAVKDLVAADNSVTLSWLVDEAATRFAGALIFSIHFSCIDENGNTVYNLPTITYSRITVGPTVWNSETIEEEYPDILKEFDSRIRALERGANVSPEFWVKSYSVVRDGQTITMTLTLEDNTTDTHVLTLDENDYPVSITVNGKTITGEWSGF